MRKPFNQRLATLLWTLLFAGTVAAQGTFPANGLHVNTPTLHAFVHCNIVQAPGVVVEDGIMVIRDGIVENVGKNISIPSGSTIHDLKGYWIFPGFIDAYATGLLEKPKPLIQGPGTPPQYVTTDKGAHAWNESIKPQVKASELFVPDAKKAAEWRALGFTTMHVVPNDGLFRGTSTLVNLGDGPLHKEMLVAEVAACWSFQRAVSAQSYPSSLMGNIALMRQTLLDAAWYAQVAAARPSRPGMPLTETNLSLEALNRQLNAKLPLIFDPGDWQDVLRAQLIAKEFGISCIFKTQGDTYQRIDAYKNLGAPLILPLNFPEAYDLKDPADAREVPLTKLWHWEAAPTNPAQMQAAKLPFALTASDLKKSADFWPMLQKAIRHGLKPQEALAALTTTPAQLLGMGNRLGSLDPGKMANFFVADDDVFAKEKVVVFESWVAGVRYGIADLPTWDPRGQYQVQAGAQSLRVLISGRLTAPKASLVQGRDTIEATVKFDDRAIALTLPLQKGRQTPQYRLFGIVIGDKMNGEGVGPDGARVTWLADLVGPMPIKADTSGKLQPVDLANIPAPGFPFAPYGWKKQPAQKVYLIKGATVWTNTSAGRLEKADVLIADGKIQGVGNNLLVPPGAETIDGTGLHVTPGIIDEHSHIAISKGVNEGSHSNTAEVRIGDVIDAEDINIYRQLSGGVTTSQLLHGSANPIGGQSAIIKLRWGALPHEMKFAEAPGFIKFALGENVKQSNWGEVFRTRYPQTRLGVEQFVRDAFMTAMEYRKQQKEANEGIGNKLPPRRDLQMETLLEIIDGRRFITCHSYVQSEILMLMRLAESLGFRVNTFTHVLEGYKVADVLKAHGANASTFSDWWAYKYEVIDAIPYNASILQKVGVNVCINSDDAEMGRRLNQEAAKAVKYGGMREEDALKMVTLNPAKALHVDAYVGTLEKGKHADLVVWSNHPLSVYAKAMKTFVDGRLYFDREADQTAQIAVNAERQRLLQKMIESPDKDKKKFEGKTGPQLYHCETMGYENE
jgi:imidazolonepropionase-like amidohydrolase